MAAPAPVGPGFPRAEPSVYTRTLLRMLSTYLRASCFAAAACSLVLTPDFPKADFISTRVGGLRVMSCIVSVVCCSMHSGSKSMKFLLAMMYLCIGVRIL